MQKILVPTDFSATAMKAVTLCKISQFFKKSKAENILKTLNIPVFITHP